LLLFLWAEKVGKKNIFNFLFFIPPFCIGKNMLLFRVAEKVAKKARRQRLQKALLNRNFRKLATRSNIRKFFSV